MSNQICDTIFVMDTEFNVIGMLSNNGAFPSAPFFDDIYVSELATGAETYEFSTYSNPITSEILELGNYIVFKYGDKYKLFQIMDNNDEHKTGQVITCYCEMAGLELLTDYCEPFSIEGNVELFFNTALQDTNWSLGGYSSSLITNIQQVKNEKYSNVYKLIQENIETYGNIEIEFRVEFDGNAVTGFFIDVYENGYRGDKTYKRFEYGENVEGIKRNRNMYDFASAMIGTGKDGLTFKDVEWRKADGKPADKPKGQDFIVDLGANERFNKRGKYIKSLFDDGDITNPQDLLLKSWEKLQEVKEPKFDYEVDLALTDGEFEDISIGDTVYVIDNDYNPPILLECRVGKLETSLTDTSKNKCTLSNYKEVASKIREPKDGENGKTPEIGPNGNWWVGGFDTGKPAQGPQGLPGSAGDPAKYVRVAGEQVFKYTSGFAGTPTPSVITIASSVIGVTNPSRVWSYKTPSMSNYVNMSSTDANIVIMHNDVIWGGAKSITLRCSVGDKYDEITLVKVSDGSQGIQGNGVKGTQEEFYLSSDKVNQPSESDPSWTASCPQWQPGKYIWTRIKMTYTNNNVEYVGYSVDTSWEAINDMQIDARNLQRYTDFDKEENVGKWDKWKGNMTYNAIDKSMKVLSDSEVAKYDTGVYHKTNLSNEGFKAGETYILSLIAKAHGGLNFLNYCYLMSNVSGVPNQGIGGSQAITEDFSKVEFTFTPKIDYPRGSIMVGAFTNAVGQGFEFKKMKVAKGNKYGGWTAAPEDTEEEIKQVDNALNQLDTSVKNAFGDDIINDSEAKAIESNIQVVNNEKADVDREYSSVYNNVKLEGTPKTNLSTSKTAYDSAHSSLVSGINTAIADKKVTQEERASVDSFFNTYRSKYADFKQRFQEALDYISSKKVDDLQIGIRNIILNSSFVNGDRYWSSWNVPAIKEFITINNKRWCHIKGTMYKYQGIQQNSFASHGITIEGNAEYTLIFKAYGVSSSDILSAGIHWRDSKTNTIINQSWKPFTLSTTEQVYSFTVTAPAGVDSFNIMVGDNDDTRVNEFYFTDLMLAKGNKLGGHIPAPEDNVANVDVMFYLSTSNTTLAGGEWQTTAPSWTDGKYMWQKTVTTLGNGQTTETAPTCIAGAKGDSGYTIVLSNENHAFPCQFNGNIPSAITTTTKVIALKGAKEITPTIGTLPTIPGLTLAKNGATITVVANVGTNLSDYGSFDIPITVDGIGFTKTFTWSKSKAGTNGTNGTNGSNGISPLNATISGQSLMKYLDKTTAPTPATIAIKCKAMKGATEVTGACSYQWQAYYNDAWNNIGTGYSINVAYNSSYFLNLDILQIRVNVTYGSETITLEHTISKVYDNKYITQQEIFNKLTENGNDFIYTDPNTGKIYINATYVKAGQLVADLIKGGILTLGGTGDNTISDYGVLRILDSEGINELARINGGEAWFEGLSATELNVEKLSVNSVESSSITQQVTSATSVYVNSSTGNDDSEFIDEAIYATLQGALDACPKNLGSKTVHITLQTDVEEDVYCECYYGGRLRIFLNGKTIYGYLRGYAHECNTLFYGGNPSDYYGLTGSIMPNKGYNHAGMSTSVSFAGCFNLFMANIKIYGATNLADGCSEDAALCCGDGGYIYIRDLTAINTAYGFRANSNAVVYSDSSSGRTDKYGFAAVSGGQVRLSNGKHAGGKTANTYESSGGTVKYQSPTFEGTSTSGSNTSKPPATTTYKATYTSNYGDTYRSSVYNSWKKDNTVREGNYGYGNCNGAWFFGSKFAELKDRTITKVTIKISRTTGGTSSSVTHTLKAHKESSRPGGMPRYIDGYSQTFGLAVGSSTTVTITNSTVLNAIKDGTCKGFGLQSSYDKSHYSVCKGSATVTIYYQ